MAAGATLAASPVDGSGVIHGCWTTTATNGGSHTFVLRNAATTCPTGPTAISWNKTGPKGATGATGSTGSTGPTGPQRPAGPTVVVTVTATGTLSTQHALALTATCPSPLVATGGGGSINNGAGLTNAYLTSSQPTVDGSPATNSGQTPNGWQATVTNQSGSDVPMNVWATCAE